MPTKNPRLNVVLSSDLFAMVESLSKKEDKSMSEVAKELIQEALENHEDLLISEVARKREGKSKKTISHDKAWK